MIHVPEGALQNPAFGNMPTVYRGASTVVYDTKYNVIYVVPDEGGMHRFDSNAALDNYLSNN